MRRFSNPFRAAFVTAATCIASFASAQTGTSPANASAPAPAAASRTVRTFDFEELDLGNVEDTPLGWVKVEGSGMPHYLKGMFDRAIAHSGRTSFRLDLNGGSIAFRYPANRIFVIGGASYRVEAVARTSTIKNARARITAYFCDIDGRPITSSITHDDLDPKFTGDEAFHPLRLDLVAGDNAASLVVEMSLLQPAMLGDHSLGDRELPVEDIIGSAWFDDVRITQVPDVAISTDRPTNIFYRGEPINIRVRLRDQLTADLTAEMRVTDVNGKPVFQRTGGITFTPSDRPHELIGTIPLPTMESGWYESRLTIRSGEEPIGDHRLRFVQLGDVPSRPTPDDRFGVNATSLPPAAWSILPEAMDQLAAGRLKLAVWTADYAIDSDKAADFDRLLSKLRARGISLTACLAALPPEIAATIGSSRWADTINVPTDRWQPQLAYLVSSHANHLTQWQLLDDDQAETLVRNKPLRDVYGKLLAEFRTLIDEPDLAMPWPAWFDLDGQLPPTVALNVPGDILPEQLPFYISDLKKDQHRNVSLTLHPIDLSKYGRAAQERDLALRIAFAIAGGADRIDLPLLLTSRTQRDRTIAEPDPLFVTQRTVTSQLSGARFLGKVPIAEGVDAFLFDRDGRGTMLVWRRGEVSDPSVQHVSIALGGAATKIDLAGRATPIGRPTPDKRRPDDFDLTVGTMPMFVTDIDPALLMLRASVALDNPLLESSFKSHGRKLVIRNTFDTPISGSVRLSGPSGWTVSLGASSFSLNPGETLEVPVTIEFPLSSSAGEKILNADLKIQARSDYRMTVPVPVKLGLGDVGLQTVALRSGNDIVVQQMITNYGATPINYTAFVTLPGQPRQERIISNLGAGKTTIRKYRFTTPVLQATKLRSGVRELEGRRMLNEEVQVD